MSADAVILDKKWLLRAGGISAIILGVSYILITGLYALGGPLPNGAEEWLKYLAGQTTAWWAILGLSVLTDFLFLPVTLALFLALKEIDRNAMLIGAILVVMFVILDLAVTWPNYSSLITLSGNYAAATSDVQRTAFVSAASYASAVLSSGLFAVYAILVPSLGILVIGLVMKKSAFHKVTAYSGMASGILGIISVVGPVFIGALGGAVILASVLTTVWVLLLGCRLYRLGQP
ncbi:MAG: hypothetical protein WBM17_04855 [Anaerolineales bacterium]